MDPEEQPPSPEDDEFEPRLYQLNARDQVIQGYEQEGKRVFLVLLPTGMGKTLISTLVIEMLLERGILDAEEKVLFMVQDRKLKHQLYEMAKTYGLAEYGHLFLLDDQRTLPAKMSRKHADFARFLFATPILLMNAVTGKTPRVDKATLVKVKVVVIDEILDIFAQSYGQLRSREETIAFIVEKYGNGRSFKEIIRDLKEELEARDTIDYEIDEQALEDHVIREFSSRNFRLNKRFEPILHLLGLLDPNSDRIVIGLTASLSQEAKVALLRKTFGGDEAVAEIRPVGDDFEDYRPAYRLRRIRVFDEWVTQMDGMISGIKGGLMKTLNQAYKHVTGREKIPPDRILLFITDLLAKKTMQKKLLEALGGDEQRKVAFLASASAYLLMTVARQRLLESTFKTFYKFTTTITNKVLLANQDFQALKAAIEQRRAEGGEDEKEKKLLYWLNRFTSNGESVLVMCRFVDMTKHLMDAAISLGIPSANVHGRMSGSMQHAQIKAFKAGKVKVLFASERLIEKGTDLPEADVGIYYGTTVSLERYEQSLGRIRSSRQRIKTFYTISYDQTVEDEKSLKRDTMFLQLIGTKLDTIIEIEED
ncbi:MAG: DEAD/DEAH box helicase [Promethearchaeota archaeon]